VKFLLGGMGSMGGAVYALCLLQMGVVEAGYAIKFVKSTRGAYPEHNGQYLCSQRYYSEDRRSQSSTYVGIDGSEEIEANDYMWEFEPAGIGPNRYHIKFASQTYGQSGWYLTAQRHYRGDARSGHSTFVSIDSFSVSQNMYVWELEPTGMPSQYNIKFVSDEYDQQGWYLTAQVYYPADSRNSHSAYVSIDSSVSGSEYVWEVVPVMAMHAMLESIPEHESISEMNFTLFP